MADRAPFIHAGANTPPQWESAGTLTASVTGDYIVYHYFVTPMVGGWSVFARPHNAKYTSLATALVARPNQLTWSNYAEIKHIYTAIFRVNTGWSNSHRCKLVSLSDYRTVNAGPVAATSPTIHAGLSGLELAAAGVTWGHIDDQTQTIAGAKTFSGYTVLGAGPAIKMKKLTGTTSNTDGVATDVAHGLTRSKIISASALVDTGTYLVPEVYTIAAGFWFEILITSTDISLKLKPGSSSNILSKSFTILVIYEE
jgi:hypothetical protein